MNVDVVAFEGLHERFGHAVGLRAAHRGEARHQAQPDRKVDRLVGSVGAPVVREPLDRLPACGRLQNASLSPPASDHGSSLR